jgi:hypothetical protein
MTWRMNCLRTLLSRFASSLFIALINFSQIALISVENKKMEISHKLFTSWLNDLTLIGSEDVIKEILRRNLQKFHSLFCKALGLLQGSFPSMLAPRFVSAATSLIRWQWCLGGFYSPPGSIMVSSRSCDTARMKPSSSECFCTGEGRGAFIVTGISCQPNLGVLRLHTQP